MLWISGDTVLYDGVKEVGDQWTVDTAMLHLGGVQFPVTGPLRYTMTAHDAIELVGLIKPRVAIPIHYEGWKRFSERRDSDRARAGGRAGRRARALQLAATRYELILKTEENMSRALVIVDIQKDYFPGGRMELVGAEAAAAARAELLVGLP